MAQTVLKRAHLTVSDRDILNGLLFSDEPAETDGDGIAALTELAR